MSISRKKYESRDKHGLVVKTAPKSITVKLFVKIESNPPMIKGFII